MPFRCLDEFDVFMDMVSRQIAMEMILQFADKFPNSGQFFLLTPMNIKYRMKKKGSISFLNFTGGFLVLLFANTAKMSPFSNWKRRERMGRHLLENDEQLPMRKKTTNSLLFFVHLTFFSFK